MKKRYVLKNKVRFTLLITLILAAAATLILATTVHGFKTPQYRKVIVENGDSLWSIASHYKPKGDDIRKYIYEIKKVNNMASSTIYEGDTLILPIND